MLFRRFFGKKLALVLLVVFVVSAHATPLHAGFFSFLSNLFGSSDSEMTFKNSQNVALLRPALNPDPNPAKGGGDVTIADGSALVSDTGPLGTRGDSEIVPKYEQISVYVVREGDSLSQIAKMFGVSVDTIIWANDIKRGDLIKQGQTLVILPVNGVEHTVSNGDTLSSIAKKYSADVGEIMNFNQIPEEYTLAIGERIIIPDGKIARTYSATSAGTVVRGVGGPSYDGYYAPPVNNGRKSQGLHGYNAVDIATLYDAPIFASASGDVIISRTGWNGGYGNYIVIAHSNGTQTVYAHNSRNIVYSGQSVFKGQVIGYVGSTGRSTGAHVHFEVRGAQNPF